MQLNNASLSLKGRALRYLAAREHSRFELESKLERHATGEEREEGKLALILDELTAKGFISEARVAESVTRSKAPKYGAMRVIEEMRRKGLSAEQISESATELKASELERATAVWQKKFSDKPTNPADYAKQARFLASRGFGAETVCKVISAKHLGSDPSD